eukprot:512101_1
MNQLISELWNIENQEIIYSLSLFMFNNGCKCDTLNKYSINNLFKAILYHFHCYKNEEKMFKNLQISPDKTIATLPYHFINAIINVFIIFCRSYLLVLFVYVVYHVIEIFRYIQFAGEKQYLKIYGSCYSVGKCLKSMFS